MIKNHFQCSTIYDCSVLGRSFETSSTGMLNERNKMKEKSLKEVLIDRKQKEKMIS